MGEFFKRNRKTIGVITLLLTLASAGWSIRSFFAHDSISISLGSRTAVGVMSACGSLIGCVQYHKNAPTTWKVAKWTTRSDPLDDDTIKGLIFWGFAICWVSACEKTGNVTSAVLVIPYWFFIVSFFLLSYSFLQSNPPPFAWPPIELWLILVAVIVIIIIVMFYAPGVQ